MSFDEGKYTRFVSYKEREREKVYIERDSCEGRSAMFGSIELTDIAKREGGDRLTSATVGPQLYSSA